MFLGEQKQELLMIIRDKNTGKLIQLSSASKSLSLQCLAKQLNDKLAQAIDFHSLKEENPSEVA